MIEVGWVNADGTETLCDDFDNETSLPAALRLVEIINRSMSEECWFVMQGQDKCPKICSECEGAMHHWIDDLELGTDEIKKQCKHCSAWRTLTARDE